MSSTWASIARSANAARAASSTLRRLRTASARGALGTMGFVLTAIANGTSVPYSLPGTGTPTPTIGPMTQENPTSQSLDPGRWRALALLAGVQFMVVLDASIVNVALPT